MSLLVGLGPLLDSTALFTIAKQLWQARERLSLRTGGHLPSAGELAIALRLYAANEDRKRLESPPLESPHQSYPDAPDATLLAQYLSIAETAYAETEAKQTELLKNFNVTKPVVCKLLAEKWSPGYFIAHQSDTNTLLLAVRGSKEVSDFLTNLSAEIEPFLGGHGHQGVVKSAENLHMALRQCLEANIESYQADRLVVVGHSLGGAVAAAMTMLLRATDGHLTEKTAEVLKSTRCYSYCAPPFLCADTAKLSEGHEITSLVNHLDIVPRLSAASVDRLLVRVSRYDWGRHMSDWVGRTVSNVASGILPGESARIVSETVTRSGPEGLSAASQTIGGTARALGGAGGPASAWRIAMTATAAVGDLLAGGLEQSRRRRDRADHGFARAFGMNEEEVERVLNDAPGEVFVAGDVWFVDREFTDPAKPIGRDGMRFDGSRMVRRDRNTLTDVEVSGWMVQDHEPGGLLGALVTIAATSEVVSQGERDMP